MARGIWTTAILLITTVAALPAPAAVEIAGVASIIDGDTIKIHGQHIRLFGIDSPESTQFCEKEGKRYRCGQQAALALSDKIGRATIYCAERDIDRYKRIVAVCRLGHGEDPEAVWIHPRNVHRLSSLRHGNGESNMAGGRAIHQ